jgi:hypothetical protein
MTRDPTNPGNPRDKRLIVRWVKGEVHGARRKVPHSGLIAQDAAHAVAGDPIEHILEAGTFGNGISTTHSLVVH